MSWWNDAWDWVADTASDVGNWVADTASDVGDWVSDNWDTVLMESGVVAGSVALAFVPGTGPWLAATTFLSGTGAVVGYEEKKESNQRQEDYLENVEKPQKYGEILSSYNSQISQWLNANLSSEDVIRNAYYDIEAIEKNKFRAEEWVSDYQAMLGGDTSGYMGLTKKTYEDAQNVAEARAALYNTQSAIQKDQTIDQGYQNYAEMMRQKAMANVMAGATGGTTGAYSAAAINQQNMINKYVGIDNLFNTTDSEEFQSGQGTFMKTLSVLNKEISVQNTVNQASIMSAKASLENYMKGLEDEFTATTDKLGDFDIQIENNRQAIQDEIQNIKDRQDNLIKHALSNWKQTAKDAGKTQKEIDDYEEFVKNQNAEVNRRVEGYK